MSTFTAAIKLIYQRKEIDLKHISDNLPFTKNACLQIYFSQQFLKTFFTETLY
jgi:hypothetical protein